MPLSLHDWVEKNRTGFSGDLSFNEPLAPFTYYKIGGPAEVLAVPRSEEDLNWLSRLIQETHAPYFVLGAGSNLLVSDSGFRGLVIRAMKMNPEMRFEEGVLHLGASVLISSLLRKASTEGWEGLEFLTGVPGSVGGVSVMNAGTHLGEAQRALLLVTVYDFETGKFRAVQPSEFKYSYRKNEHFKPSEIVWSTKWNVKKAPPAEIKAKIDALLVRRKNSQPVEFPSCGSVFKNPKAHGKHAWQVIEDVELRGHRVGGAQFAEKHANFIINTGGAKAADVKALIDLAKERAQERLGIKLEEEVKLIGF